MKSDPRFFANKPLTVTLSPRNWSEIQGQAVVVERLQRFCARPYPNAFLFHGATGCGKNCTARVLAAQFGCDIEGGQLRQQMSGFFDLCATVLTSSDVEQRLRSAWYAAMNSSGWKIIVVSEADKLREEAKQQFLHALDYPPPSAIWVFTTNELDKMDRRFTTRCEQLGFESDAEMLAGPADQWLADLWRAGGGKGRAPRVVDMPGATQGGHLSYRALVVGLQSKL
jgi:DNA polymerase III gamma/tau subunit